MSSSELSLSKKKASAYVVGTSILWGSLVEFGIAEMLRVWTFGLLDLVFALSRVQADLVIGFGEFLATIVRVWTRGPTAAISAAWDGAAFEVFGPLAPVVVIAEIMVVVGVATWAVRRL